MIEYIERDAAKRAMEPIAPVSIYRIDSIPAASVEPVVYGTWIDGDENCPICHESKFNGLDADIWADWKPQRCPNCGAHMT